jgi:hypothetical protein
MSFDDLNAGLCDTRDKLCFAFSFHPLHRQRPSISYTLDLHEMSEPLDALAPRVSTRSLPTTRMTAPSMFRMMAPPRLV